MNFHSTHGDGLPVWRREPRLAKALAASAVLHLVLLWPAAVPRPKLQIAQPLAAELRPVAAVAAPAVAVAEQPPVSRVPAAPTEPRKTATAPQRPRSVRAERPPVIAAAEPQPQAAPPVQAEASRQQPAGDDDGAGTGAVAPARMGDSGTALVSSGSGLPAAGVDPQALVEYRFALVRSAAPRYPPLARERGWSGRVEVRLTVAEDGRPREASITRSAGYALLDEEARSTIALAASRAPLPMSLRGRAFVLEVPVIFRIEDAGAAD
jgi:protein TonB